MARTFTNGATNSQLLPSPVSTVPLTLACWFKAANVTVTGSLVASLNTGNDQYFALIAAGATVGDPLQAVAVSGGSGVTAQTSTPYTAGTWFHGCAVFASTTSRAAYINGGSVGTNATSKTVTAGDKLWVPGGGFTAEIAEVGVWNIALSADDALQLARGVSPLMVRPDGLVFYAPIYGRASPETNVMGSGGLSLVGSPPYADHCRIIYPTTGQSLVTRRQRRGKIFSNPIIKGRMIDTN